MVRQYVQCRRPTAVAYITRKPRLWFHFNSALGLQDIFIAWDSHAHLVSKDVNLHQLFSDGAAFNTQATQFVLRIADESH